MNPLRILISVLLFPGCPSIRAEPAPNIVFILADDLGKEWISCYGAEDIRTPNLDALAAGGMKFHHAWSMPQCTPSRVAFLTGTYPWRNGWVNHWDTPRWGVGYFDWKQARNTTVARLLREAGHATAAAGKWQINDFRQHPQAMKHHGFDDWLMWTGQESGNRPSAQRYANPYLNSPQGSGVRKGAFGPDLYTDHLIAFMRKHRDKPFFLYHAMALPHAPFTTTPDEPKAQSNIEKHQAMVRYLDKQVGRIVAALGELGLRERTFLFFTTDNGSGRNLIGTRDGRKIAGGKAEKSEAGICAPFIVNAPGRVPAGAESRALIDFTDLLPTFLDLAGVEVPAGLTLDGVSFAPVLLGETKQSARQWIMSLGHGPARREGKTIRGVHDFAPRVIRDEQFKVWVDRTRKIERLHDLASDPFEERNLLETELSLVQQQALAKFQAVVASLPEKDARPLYDPADSPRPASDAP